MSMHGMLKRVACALFAARIKRARSAVVALRKTLPVAAALTFVLNSRKRIFFESVLHATAALEIAIADWVVSRASAR